tara:strand:+ start:24689 stop:26335 length:1647 start_codon:yes stop_codon:yes gene_type:complete
MRIKYLKFRSIGIIISLLAINFLLIGCENKEVPSTEQAQIKGSVSPGLKTEMVQEKDYRYLIYVNANTDGTGNGEKKNPFQSITAALNFGSDKKITGKIAILVAEGEYHETTIQMQPGIDLYGGFNAVNWQRNIEKFKTIIDPDGKNRVIEGANDSKIDGFIISGGKINGKGAGIICSGVSPTISNNVFMTNHTLGPQNWNPEYWHETANNGGAVYCENGSQATIRNCVFINNTTENGRGAGIAADNKCKLLISGNVFIDNKAGINDPMRSSDGGAISIFNWCQAEITHNIFLSNKALNHNDGGGVFVALWSSAKINENIFVDNIAGDDAGGLFVGGQEHRYGGAPLDPIPATEDFSVDISNNLFLGNKNSSMNSGVMRFTMESKGSYTNNISALNNGIYFQRSEVAVKENIILDDFLFIETKKGLLPGEIKNNLIWGDFLLDVNPSVSDNIIKGKLDSLGAQFKVPKFANDGGIFPVISLNVNKKELKTEVLIDGEKFKENSLVNRVVRSGNKWGVIKSNSDTYITIWGNLYGAESIQLLPTYTEIK